MKWRCYYMRAWIFEAEDKEKAVKLFIETFGYKPDYVKKECTDEESKDGKKDTKEVNKHDKQTCTIKRTKGETGKDLN